MRKPINPVIQTAMKTKGEQFMAENPSYMEKSPMNDTLKHGQRRPMSTTIASLSAAWERASGHPLRPRVWERAISDFIEAGFTEEDVALVFRYARRENAKFTSAIQGFTITPFKVFDFEYRWFDSLLSQARASERNRRPAPTAKEAVIALREKPVEPELGDKRAAGVGLAIKEVFKNLGNQ